MKQIYEFLDSLGRNNDREWFMSNREWYLRVKERFDGYAAGLIGRIGSFDPSVSGLGLGDCTYRIYRDVRFSADKSPYKTHMGVYVCPGGKKSWHSRYYLHIEPDYSGTLSKCMLMSVTI